MNVSILIWEVFLVNMQDISLTLFAPRCVFINTFHARLCGSRQPWDHFYNWETHTRRQIYAFFLIENFILGYCVNSELRCPYTSCLKLELCSYSEIKMPTYLKYRRVSLMNRVYKSFVVHLMVCLSNGWIFIFWYTESYSKISLRGRFCLLLGKFSKLYFGWSTRLPACYLLLCLPIVL